MSRLIPGKPDRSEDMTMRCTEEGKLIITTYQGQALGYYIKGNRLLQVILPHKQSSRVGMIYLGKIKQIKANIDACFVEITDHELVYLPLSSCKFPFLTNRPFDGRILVGDELLVQIVRDPLKTKQAAASAKITLSNRYAVFQTGSAHTGISGKLSGDQKTHLQEFLFHHGFIDDSDNWIGDICGSLTPYGAVIRTEAVLLEETSLYDQLKLLETQFLTLLKKALHSTCFTCFSTGKSPWEMALEQLPSKDYCEVVTDLPQFAKDMHPYFAERNIAVRLYQDEKYSLAKLYSLNTKLEDALGRRIWLKSGAYLVVDNTEALTVFDVNSGKYEPQKTSEETFYRVNMEAAREIALQIRLRNLSGIIIVDFINMKDTGKQRALLEFMESLTCQDPVYTKVVDITPLGLVEITRKKINKPLTDYFKGGILL